MSGHWAAVHYLAWEPVARFFEDAADFHAKTGIHSRQYTRWSVSGKLHWDFADKIAVALGTHPELIWGDEWHQQTKALATWDQDKDRRKRDRNRKFRARQRAREEALSLERGAPPVSFSGP